MKNIIKVLFPFFATLFLWRLSSDIINPNGILALIPIFYYSIVKEHNEFIPMALIGCFLLDRNFDLILFWTILFCLLYAAAGLQSVISFSDRRLRSTDIFMIFTGVGISILGIWSSFLTASFIPILTALWMFLISAALYAPITYMFERIECWIKK
jgi:hypothetical protein